MKKISTILALLLILSVVAVAGCTSDDKNTQSNTMSNTQSVQNTQTPTTTTTQTSQATHTYIGNSNSKIFHEPSCRYVSKINSGNKVTFSSRDEATNAGYRACEVFLLLNSFLFNYYNPYNKPI